MNRLIFAMSFVFSALLLVGITGCGRTTHAQQKSTDDQEGIRVMTMKLKKKNLVRTTTQPARIEAYEETPLFARIDGYVVDIKVDIGQKVEKGDILATLWVPEMEKELVQKEAMVKRAKADVDLAAKEIEVAEASVALARAKVEEAKSALVRAKGTEERWKSEYARIKTLVANGSVTRQLEDESLQQFTAAEGTLQEVNAGVNSAQAAFDQSEIRVEKARADLRSAQAGEEVAQAGVEQMKAMLEYSNIRAPFDGKVTQRNVDSKHYISAGGKAGKPLFVVTSTDKVRVFVDVPELESGLVNVGDDVTLRISALPGYIADSAPKVTRTSWSLQGSARTLLTEIEMDNKGGLLRPGMYASVTITLDERHQVFTLPVSATVVNDDKAFCFVVNNGKAEKRAISLGLRSGDEMEVVAGLQGDEAVIATNVSSLQEGQAVMVGEEKK
jgi:HlyD family secretion protein